MNQSKALLTASVAILLVCISYTVGLNVNQKHALSAVAAATKTTDHTSYRQGTMDTVYTICNESRLSPTIHEEQCGNIQDATHTEFLCASNNTSPATHCWVEDKE